MNNLWCRAESWWVQRGQGVVVKQQAGLVTPLHGRWGVSWFNTCRLHAPTQAVGRAFPALVLDRGLQGCRGQEDVSHHCESLNSDWMLKQNWALIPFKKFLWESRIWTTSLYQACCISIDEACMMKRVILPSFPLEVRTRQYGSSSEGPSTPKQLTYRAEIGKIKQKENKISIISCKGSPLSSPWCCFWRYTLAKDNPFSSLSAHWR